MTILEAQFKPPIPFSDLNAELQNEAIWAIVPARTKKKLVSPPNFPSTYRLSVREKVKGGRVIDHYGVLEIESQFGSTSKTDGRSFSVLRRRQTETVELSSDGVPHAIIAEGDNDNPLNLKIHAIVKHIPGTDNRLKRRR